MFTAQISLILCQALMHSILEIMKMNFLYLIMLNIFCQTFARILDSLTYDIQYIIVKRMKQMGKSTKET